MSARRLSSPVSTLGWLLLAAAMPACYSFDRIELGEIELDEEGRPPCDPGILVAPQSPALVVTDPVALERLSLRNVLTHMDVAERDQEELLQRLFDTFNSEEDPVFAGQYRFHCDSPENPAFKNRAAATCPRPEGALAESTGFFTEGHPDHFYPVAAVNRFDLGPSSTPNCGELRLIYAKESGKTDPDNRVFLIFETSTEKPFGNSSYVCYPMQKAWWDLQFMTAEEQRGKLYEIFLYGLSGFGPVVTPGAFASSSGYYGVGGGRIRLSVHVGEHWELRQLRFTSKHLEPTLLDNNPMPHLFSGSVGEAETDGLIGMLNASAETLASTRVEDLRLLMAPQFLSGESALGGRQMNDYVGRAAGNPDFLGFLQREIDDKELSNSCPEDDPLTADSLVRRATVQSCAGCHAPAQLLGPERKLGCGLTFPDSLGEVHIDEHGNLSPALKEVFLPQRAALLTSYLRACDADSEL